MPPHSEILLSGKYIRVDSLFYYIFYQEECSIIICSVSDHFSLYYGIESFPRRKNISEFPVDIIQSEFVFHFIIFGY